jgi:hypothetical protein
MNKLDISKSTQQPTKRLAEGRPVFIGISKKKVKTQVFYYLGQIPKTHVNFTV